MMGKRTSVHLSLLNTAIIAGAAIIVALLFSPILRTKPISTAVSTTVPKSESHISAAVIADTNAEESENISDFSAMLNALESKLSVNSSSVESEPSGKPQNEHAQPSNELTDSTRAAVNALVNRDHGDLVIEPAEGGGEKVDLKRHFRTVPVATRQADGSIVVKEYDQQVTQDGK